MFFFPRNYCILTEVFENYCRLFHCFIIGELELSNHRHTVPSAFPKMDRMPNTWAVSIPMVIKSWGTMPMAPRRFFGESSPKYMGTTLEEIPGKKRAISVALVQQTSKGHYKTFCISRECTSV